MTGRRPLLTLLSAALMSRAAPLPRRSAFVPPSSPCSLRGLPLGRPHEGRSCGAVTRRFAAPRAQLPDRRVDVSCATCGAKLFRYAKGNGAGSQLVKVYAERIVRDYTGGRFVTCPDCGTDFAREATMHGRRAFKIIGGKVRMK